VPILCPSTNHPSLIIILVGSILSNAPQEGKDTENEEGIR
jgi:hypothetical protein